MSANGNRPEWATDAALWRVPPRAIPISHSDECPPTGQPELQRVQEITLARYEQARDTVWMCRNLINTHLDGSRELVVQRMTFENYEDGGHDSRESVSPESAWNWSADPSINDCYDGDATDWRNRRLRRHRIIAAWEARCPEPSAHDPTAVAAQRLARALGRDPTTGVGTVEDQNEAVETSELPWATEGSTWLEPPHTVHISTLVTSEPGPTAVEEPVYARFDEDGCQLWICRNRCITFNDQSQQQITKWLRYDKYAPSGHDSRVGMAVNTSFNYGIFEHRLFNKCYVGELLPRELSKEGIIALWEDRCAGG